LFAERQRSAGLEPNIQFSLAHALGDRDFSPNIDAPTLTALGASGELARAFGIDPTRVRLAARTRVEGAITKASDPIGDGGYARLMTTATISRGLGPLAAALTGAAGAATGDLTPQRAFYVGGLHTVRGQSARADAPGYIGDAMWLGRGELGLGVVSAKPVLFYDVGWAGRREDFSRPGRPLSGAGVGLSFLDGLIRTDLAKGIWPEKGYRLDFYLDALF
jgi:hemolysin activation/secretion protein